VDVLRDAGVHLADPADRTVRESVAAVVVGWDTGFDRDRLQCAAEALWAGAQLLVTSDARSFASRGRPTAGLSGFIARGLTHVTGREYEVLGKPSAMAMSVASRRLGTPPCSILVIGDDLSLEARMARAAGALGVLVTTGTHDRADVANADQADLPDLVVDTLPELLSLWHPARAEQEERA
jgi:NagD protein